MIIVHLIGGLGNQLFQYALGRKLSIINRVPLKLDVSGFETYKVHKYSLKYFNITEKLATKDEIEDLKYGKKLKIARKLVNRYANSYIKEKSFNFDKSILSLLDDVYLEGYWQSEKYFGDIEDTIRKDLTLKYESDEINKKTLNEIKECNSVSLHIRRGDYISNKEANKFHGLCSLEYYYEASKKVEDLIKNPVFFIFSDDIKWVKENLKLKHPMIFVSNNAEKNYEDLNLMRECKHHIIANSTFSWWAAWLGDNQDKIVIAPKKWFNADVDTKDIIPDTWIRI